MRFAALPFAAIALALASAAPAQDEAKGPARSAAQLNGEAAVADAAANWARPSAEEREVTTTHSIAIGRATLKYRATAGTLTVRDAEGKPRASMFYVAYTLDGTRPGTKRPITFIYNGGPGSPSLWLHMGSFAPVRLRTANPEYIRPAPYDFGPNPDTLLDKTDMVFLDPVGASYSRPLGDAKPADFYGVDSDAESFAGAIQRYITKADRWTSPKFIFGESYGTTRSGALAWALQDRGIALNGVVLLSSIMNYGYRQPGLDNVYLAYLPSYAATAWYHNRVQNRVPDVAAWVQQARDFAAGPFASALAKGQTISAEEKQRVAAEMSRLTGLSVDFILRSNLRVDLSRFQKELLRDRRLTIGRFDSRYTGIDADAAGERPEFDASSEAISGAFIATISDYLRRDLGWKTDLPYRLSARDGAGWSWDWRHRAAGSGQVQNNPNTAIDLSAAMRTNPYLKVLSLNGWYDMATPFYGTEFDLGHMMLEPAQAANLSYRYYPAGHMTYLNPDALRQMRIDLVRWYDEATAAPAPAVPTMAGAQTGAAGPN